MTRPSPSRLRADADGDYLRALLDKDFTNEQMAIITAPLCPQLVIAGAGTGKTMVMAARVVHAVAHFGVAPSRVLGLTFTNKAAGELAERVRGCLARLRLDEAEAGGPRDDADDADDEPIVATYNSYAAQIVRDHALRIGREPGATLLTEAVQWQLAMRVATRAPGPFSHLNWTTSYTAGLIVELAGDLSDHLATAEHVRHHDAEVRAAIETLARPPKGATEIIARTRSRDELLDLVASYTAEKQRLDVIDFGDQVALACAIATGSSEVVALERARLATLTRRSTAGAARRPATCRGSVSTTRPAPRCHGLSI
jgi:ATP-dependent DNA helicase UvrD/PcrA